MIYITHDLATAYYISDRLIIMQRGQVVEMGEARPCWILPSIPIRGCSRPAVLSTEDAGTDGLVPADRAEAMAALARASEETLQEREDGRFVRQAVASGVRRTIVHEIGGNWTSISPSAPGGGNDRARGRTRSGSVGGVAGVAVGVGDLEALHCRDLGAERPGVDGQLHRGIERAVDDEQHGAARRRGWRQRQRAARRRTASSRRSARRSPGAARRRGRGARWQCERVEDALPPRRAARLGADRCDHVHQPLGLAGDGHPIGVPQQRQQQVPDDDGVECAVVGPRSGLGCRRTPQSESSPPGEPGLRYHTFHSSNDSLIFLRLRQAGGTHGIGGGDHGVDHVVA